MRLIEVLTRGIFHRPPIFFWGICFCSSTSLVVPFAVVYAFAVV